MMKKEIRSQIIQEMHHPSYDKEVYEKSLLNQFLSHPSYRQAHTIATYLSMEHEYNTLPLIEAAQRDQKRVVVPKTISKGRMIFVDYNPSDLELSKFGVWEPISGKEVPKEEIDLIHVPGLAFNEEGFRIGYGGGFYDSYLSDFEGKTISTIFPCQERSFIPDEHDIPVSEVLK